MVPERYWKFHGPEVRARVAALARVADENWMQDWPREVNDPSRLDELIALCEGAADPDDRFALMDLVLWSIEDAEPDIRDKHWPRAEAMLLHDPALFAYQIIDWAWFEPLDDGSYCLFDEPDTALAARMRPVLERVRTAIGFVEAS